VRPGGGGHRDRAAAAAASVFRDLGVVTLLRDLEPLVNGRAGVVEPQGDAATV
jgi:hypothetical protein